MTDPVLVSKTYELMSDDGLMVDIVNGNLLVTEGAEPGTYVVVIRRTTVEEFTRTITVTDGGIIVPPGPKFVSPRLHTMQQRASAGTSRFKHSRLRIPLSRTAANLRFYFPAWFVDFSNPAETASGFAHNIEGAVLVVNGVNHDITFGGEQAYSIASGEGVWCDAISSVSPGVADEVYLDWVDNTPASSQRCGGYTLQPQNGDFVKSSTSSLLAELGTVVSGSTITKRTAYGPTMAVADWTATDGPVVLIIGSSSGVEWEYAGALAGPRCNMGWMQQMLDSTVGGRMGVGNVSGRGNTLLPTSAGGAAGCAKRVAAINELGSIPFTSILYQVGLNAINVNTALVLEDVQTAFRSAWAYWKSQFPRIPIFQATIQPVTGAGTTAWTDEVGQVCGNVNVGPDPSIRSQINAWITSNPPEINGHIVSHSSIIGTDPAKWKTTGFSATLVNAVTAAQANPYRLSAAPPLGVNLVFEPGGGVNLDNNADYTVTAVADMGGGQYDVKLNRAVIKAHAAASVVGTSLTPDGTHQGPYSTDLVASEAAAQKAVFNLPG